LETIDELFREIGDQRFDLIIDDGLHTFEANSNTLFSAFKHLRDGGLYIVEDVEIGYFGKWDEFLRLEGYDGALIKLPSEKNQRDNCIVFLVKRPE
jgi:hypothetical protein